ncbi:MAG: helix-turn-helix transcriptional regulator [Oscillospiraceae bacterium]|nr:helix-turn-helix transcriptional regulator [Oscillospiraceae bacterium]
MRKHCHNHFEIYFITKGNCCYFIENKVYHLIPGDIILIPEGIMHNTEYQNTIYTRKLISCSEYFIPECIKSLLPSLLYLYRNPEIIESVEQIFSKVEEEYANKDSLSEDIFKCYTHMLFFLLVRHPNQYIPQQEEKHYIDDAIHYLQNNYTQQISLQDVSGRYFVSPEHFSRVFKQKTGFNVSEYLNILRLQKAENLLKQLTAAPITEIAEDCGFNDSNYFCVKFKKLYGMPPKKFQTLHKNAGKTTK